MDFSYYINIGSLIVTSVPHTVTPSGKLCAGGWGSNRELSVLSAQLFCKSKASKRTY